MKAKTFIDKNAADQLELGLKDFQSSRQKKENKQNKSDLHQNKKENKGRIWLENSPVCTKILDGDFNLQYMSCAGTNALKIDEVSDYYDKPYPFSFFPKQSKIEILQNLEKVKEHGETITSEAPICDVHGNVVWYQAIISRVDHPDGTLDCIMVVSSEITKRKKVEEKLKLKNEELINQNKKHELLNAELKDSIAALDRAKKKAEESEKLKSSFLANLSHEIRTPLNAILGFSRLLKEDQDIKPEEKHKFLAHIEHGGKRLLRIITDIVDISKIDVKQLSISNKECDLNALIDNLQKEFSMQLEGKEISLTVKKELSDLRSKVLIDETRLAQILSNIIENASKFTKKGQIQFGYKKDEKMLQFFVRDTGIGIPKDHVHLIFDRFRQVDNGVSDADSGTGLGLSISKELVKLMKGEIWVESNLGAGTTFYFTIPFVQAASSSPIKKKGKVLKSNAKRTILIAEDEEINLFYLKAILKEFQFNILHAENGKEAVEIVQSRDDIELILMDLRMPIMDGMEAVAEIRKNFKQIPIVAQTAYAMAEDKEKALQIGCNDYLSKPISKQEVIEMVDKYLYLV